MPAIDEHAILSSPTTRRLVHEIIRLADQRDPLDAARDAELAAAILRARLEPSGDHSKFGIRGRGTGSGSGSHYPADGMNP